MRSQPRAGDFSRVWPLLSPRARVLTQELVREFAQPSAALERVNIEDAIDRNPHLSPAQRAEFRALLALLEDRA